MSRCLNYIVTTVSREVYYLLVCGSHGLWKREEKEYLLKQDDRSREGVIEVEIEKEEVRK